MMLQSEKPFSPAPGDQIAKETAEERADDTDQHRDDDPARVTARHQCLGDRARHRVQARSKREWSYRTPPEGWVCALR